MGKVGIISGHYEPHKVEDEIKKFWDDYRIYDLVKKNSMANKTKFSFLDGPPYPSSDIPHVGTAWNKSLKDAVLRYKRMRGYNVLDQPGYDCHGLPIEVAVEKKVGIRIKREIEEKVGVGKFINMCKSLVNENIASLTKWFKELGVFMDWDNPYLTMKDEYIEAGWWLIKKAYEKGLLCREKKIVYWCPRCSTTLAEYEIEYKTLVDPSIYVMFPVKNEENTYLLIWTTTPWTLPANTFVMIHPDAIYVKVRVDDKILILAKERLEKVMSEAGIKEYEVIAEFKGKEIEGIEYTHPLEKYIPLQKRLSKYHKVVSAPEFVTLHEGTGLVHSAPGHGFEDFIVAQRIGVKDIAAPIDDEGKFTEEAGKYTGLYVRDANKVIIEDLKRENALFYHTTVSHRYPVCWRCKTPVTLRATTQWIIKVTKLKEKLIEEAKNAKWMPKWALDRLMSMLDNLQDWVLSRQRYWGTPLPIWTCPNGHMVVIGSIKELEQYAGKRPKELHRPWIDEISFKCPYCGKEMKRVPDVADVWFDSGIAFYASRGHPDTLPVEEVVSDFITEGHDQTRGWFFSLLRAGVIGFDRVPYKLVLVHGFALDEHGREMHKSLGNYVGLNEVIERVGRDVFRYWVLQNTVWEDLRFSWKGLEETRKDLSVTWNVYVFASTYMNLDNYDPIKEPLNKYINDLRVEDKWILSKLNTLIKKVTKAMDEYRIHDAVRLTRNFIIEDVSHWYIRLIRPRVWVEENTRDKLAAYATLYTVLKNWLILVAPFAPFFTEKIYQEFIRKAEEDAPPSIHLMKWPEPVEELIDEKLEKQMDIIREIFEAAAAARMKVQVKLRHPVKKVIVFTSDKDVIETVNKHRELIAKVVNAKEIEVKEPSLLEKLLTYRIEPVYSVLGPEFRSLTKKIIKYLEEKSNDIAKDIISKGYHETVIDGEKVRLEQKHVKIIPVFVPGYSVQETRWGSVAIDTKLTREEIAEGLARDVIRRIQAMRKELNLPLDAKIEAFIACPDEHKEMLEEKKQYIATEVRAEKILIIPREEVEKIEGLKKTWDILGEEYVIVVKPLR